MFIPESSSSWDSMGFAEPTCPLFVWIPGRADLSGLGPGSVAEKRPSDCTRAVQIHRRPPGPTVAGGFWVRGAGGLGGGGGWVRGGGATIKTGIPAHGGQRSF